MQINHIPASRPFPLFKDVAADYTLQLSCPFHLRQRRSGFRCLRNVFQYFFPVKFKKLHGPRRIKTAGKNLFCGISIFLLDLVCTVSGFNSEKAAFLHHTGTAQSHRIGAPVQNPP